MISITKKYFPSNVQATCDSQGSFIDVECKCKWPDSVCGTKVFSSSYACQSLQYENLAKTHFILLAGFEAME